MCEREGVREGTLVTERGEACERDRENVCVREQVRKTTSDCESESREGESTTIMSVQEATQYVCEKE